MRLIDADALKLADFQDFSDTDVMNAIDAAPTISAALENKPLSLEQLQHMDGEPVWCEWIGVWALVRIDDGGGIEVVYPDRSQNSCDEIVNCGFAPIAYAHKPERKG